MPKESNSRKEEIIHKIKASLRKSHHKWSEEKIIEVAHKIYNKRNEAKDSNKKRMSNREDDEDYYVYGYIRTTYPDTDGIVTPKVTLERWESQVNGGFSESSKGDYHHDRDDEHLLSRADYAEVLPFEDGNYGLWIADFVNTRHPGFKSYAKYELENGLLPGYSVEYDKRHEYKVGSQTIVPPQSDLWGYAHASRPYNLQSLKTSYRENGYNFARIPNLNLDTKKTTEEINMGDEDKPAPAQETKPEDSDVKNREDTTKEVPVQEPDKNPEVKDREQNPLDSFKKELENLTLKMREITSGLEPEKKVLVKDREHEEEEKKMELPIRFREMNDAVEKRDWLAFREAGKAYINDNSDEIKLRMRGEGIPLRTTMKMRSVGNKLEIIKGPDLKFRDILGSGSNAGAYTETSVEFADIYQPGIVEMYNNAPGLLGAMTKEDWSGGPFYQWRIETSRNTAGGAVDPDNVSVETGYITKLKLEQEIKVYRYGVAVNDYTLHHSAKEIGDLFQFEVNKAMQALLHKLGQDLYREGVGTTSSDTQILGLEAVADSTGNATLYGKTRSTYSDTLVAASLTDTFVNNNGDVVEAELRNGCTKLETEGSMPEDIMLVTTPTVRGYLLNLMDTSIRFASINATASQTFGFNKVGTTAYFDGYPILVDFRCTSTNGSPIYIIDRSAWKLIMSKAPQLTGLAKVSASESAYVETYLTTVYTHPRRIHLYDNNSGPTS